MEKLKKDYVVDSILEVKRSILEELFVTEAECRLVSEALEQKLKENGYCIKISTELDFNSNFEVVSQEVIIKKESPVYPVFPLKSYIYDDKVREIIYDKKFIISCLYRMHLKKTKNLKVNL